MMVPSTFFLFLDTVGILPFIVVFIEKLPKHFVGSLRMLIPKLDLLHKFWPPLKWIFISSARSRWTFFYFSSEQVSEVVLFTRIFINTLFAWRLGLVGELSIFAARNVNFFFFRFLGFFLQNFFILSFDRLITATQRMRWKTLRSLIFLGFFNSHFGFLKHFAWGDFDL